MGKGMASKDAEDFLDDLEDLADEELDAEEWSSLSAANGFITAVILSPKLIEPAEWLPLLAGDSPEDPADGEVAAARELLTIEHSRVLDCLAARDGSYSPSFWEDENGRLITKDWAEGFIAGMQLSEAAWDRLLDDEDSRAGLFPVFVLLEDEELLASIVEEGGPSPEECLLAAQAELPLVVQDFFELSPHGTSRMEGAKEPQNKVGRNDPCPCGSGKKYKKCCLN